ncbi:hypothetical protein HYS82_03150 [Candidatus Amesbacteria bacterium]|nr:hypothetical protein [Candidatus Amesbacteria bacterium]MBI2587277.1 hypothetical protein [Candidatus Amesbacteria bacterium]
MRREDRRKAIELRKKGLSYSEIRKRIVVGKSTISDWLKNIELTEAQKQRLYERKLIGVEKLQKIMKSRREMFKKEVYDKQKALIGSLSERELLMVGLGLYWGEGRKGGSQVSISNTDPSMVNLFLKWLEQCFEVARTNRKLRVILHLYSDMNFEKEAGFWRGYLGLSEEQFNKPYVKVNSRLGLDHKGFGHGTCMIYYSDVKIKEQIRAAIKLISEK